VADLRAPFLVVGATGTIAFLASLRLPRPPRAAAEAAVAIATPTFDRSVIVLLIANACLLSAFGGFITTFAPYATAAFSWSTAEIGIVFSIFGIGGIALAAPLGSLADRRGRRLVGTYATIPVFLFGLALALALPRPAIYLCRRSSPARGSPPSAPAGSRSSRRRRPRRGGAGPSAS